MAEKAYISKYPNYRILKPSGQIIQFQRRRYSTSNPAEQNLIEGLKQFGTAEIDFDSPTSAAALPDQRVAELEEVAKAKDAKITELEAELEKLKAAATVAEQKPSKPAAKRKK